MTHDEDVLEPDLPIVDAHHHLLEQSDTGAYLLPELLADTGSGHQVVATVCVEWQPALRSAGSAEPQHHGEIALAHAVAVADAAASEGGTMACAGIVGHADLLLGAAVADVLAAQVELAGDRLKGIRYMTATDAAQSAWNTATPRPAQLLASPALREGFAQLDAFRLSFDAWCYHPQLPEVVDLARAFPATPIVLDHLGGPLGVGPYAGRRDEVFARWSDDIRSLAACPNVFVKVGGLGMSIFGFGADHAPEPLPSEALAQLWRPYVETCVDAFGADRSMFESNFPVDRPSCSYLVLWNAFKRLASGSSADEKAALFAGTAQRFYRLAPAATAAAASVVSRL